MNYNIICLIDIANDNAMFKHSIGTRMENNGNLQAPEYADKIKVTLGHIVSAFISNHNKNSNRKGGKKQIHNEVNLQWSFRLFHSLKKISPKELARYVHKQSPNGVTNNVVDIDESILKEIQTSFHSITINNLNALQHNLHALLDGGRNSSANNDNNNGSDTTPQVRRQGFLCRVLMDILKPSEWVVNGDMRNNDDSFSNDDDQDSFENTRTNYIFLFTPYPTTVEKLRLLLNTRSLSPPSSTTGGKDKSSTNVKKECDENHVKQKEAVDHLIDTVHKMLKNSFEKMSIKLVWIDTTADNMAELGCQFNSEVAVHDETRAKNEHWQEASLCRNACAQLSMQLGVPGFNMNELLLKSKLLSIDKILIHHFFDKTLTLMNKDSSQRKKKKNRERSCTKYTKKLFQGRLHLHHLTKPPTKLNSTVNKNDDDIFLEILSFINTCNNNGYDESRTNHFSNSANHKLVLESLISNGKSMSMYMTNLVTHVCRPKLCSGEGNVQNFQTLMLYLSSQKKCAILAMYEIDNDIVQQSVGEHLEEIKNVFENSDDDKGATASAGKQAPATHPQKSKQSTKFVKLFLLKPLTPVVGLISILPTYADQLDCSDNGNSSSGSVETTNNTTILNHDIVDTHTQVHPYNPNYNLNSMNENGNICPPPSIMLNLNANKESMSNNLFISNSKVNVVEDDNRSITEDTNHTDSSQVTMIVSSSSDIEGEAEDVPIIDGGATNMVKHDIITSNEISELIDEYGVVNTLFFPSHKTCMERSDQAEEDEPVNIRTTMDTGGKPQQEDEVKSTINNSQKQELPLAPIRETEEQRLANAYSAFKNSCMNLLSKKTQRKMPAIRELSKLVLPTLYTRLGSKDGRHRYLSTKTCETIRAFIKDNLLISKSGLKQKYIAKNKINTTATTSDGTNNIPLSREHKILEYQIQIYLRMEVASLNRSEKALQKKQPIAALAANSGGSEILKPRDPITKKVLKDICSLLQSISFLMDANAKLSLRNTNEQHHHGNGYMDYENTSNMSIGKFLELILVSNFKRILPLTLLEIYDELNVELAPSLVIWKSKLLVNNAMTDHSSSEGNNINNSNNGADFFPRQTGKKRYNNVNTALDNEKLENALLLPSPSTYFDPNNMELTRTNSNSSTSSSSKMIESCLNVDDNNTRKNSNRKSNAIMGLSVNSSLDRAGGLVTERKSLLNNFTQKLSNPKLLFRSVIVPKSKAKSINKRLLLDNRNGRRKARRGKSSNNGHSHKNIRVRATGKRKKYVTKEKKVVEETPERKKSNKKVRKSNNSKNGDGDKLAGNTKLVRKKSFRQLF